MNTIYQSPLCDDEDDEKKKMPEMPDPLTEKFLKTRQILLSGEINKDLADKIVRQLLVLEADSDKKTIYMYIDSPGGDVDAGFAIFDMIRFITAPVYTIGIIPSPEEGRVGWAIVHPDGTLSKLMDRSEAFRRLEALRRGGVPGLKVAAVVVAEI